MKILVLGSTYPRWENDTEPAFVHYLAKHCGSRDSIDVLAPHTQGAKKTENLDGIPVYRFQYFIQRWQKIAYDGGIGANLKRYRYNYLILPLFFLSQIFSILKLQRRNQYQLIHAHWIIPQGFSAAICKLLLGKKAPKLLITSHGGDLFSFNGRLSSKLKRWILSKADHITVVSTTMKDHMQGWENPPSCPITVQSMGVDLKNLFTTQGSKWADRKGLIFIGRLVDKKGLEFLVRALPQVLTQHNNINLTIVGDGPLKPSLQALCQKLNISNSVRFIGAVKNEAIPALLRQHKIAVFPSIVTDSGDQEGLGLTIIEAMGCGCLAICSDLKAIEDIIADKKNGFLFPQKDSNKLAAVINSQLNNTNIEQIAQQGNLDVLKEFDWNKSGNGYSFIYYKLTGKTVRSSYDRGKTAGSQSCD